ncbi:hypothetical protein [Lacrimispora celerecrescens]|nr:hypothetical protein [Lacrimispora celerecrescens]
MNLDDIPIVFGVREVKDENGNFVNYEYYSMTQKEYQQLEEDDEEDE